MSKSRNVEIDRGHNAFNIALARAGNGITWGYPCLIWFADYIRDATDFDPAAEWRDIRWDETKARRIMSVLALQSEGATEVERALATTAARNGWREADAAEQGAVMFGVYRLTDSLGVVAVYDGAKRWLIAGEDGARITAVPPSRMWVVA